MSSITLYPSNWLYNAGVVGFSSLFVSAGEDVEALLSNDGSINLDEDKISKILSSPKANHLAEPLNNMPIWHWNYAKMSFEWKYRNIENFVTDILERAQRTTNRTQLKSQLQCKDFVYESCSIDLGSINQRIDNVWKQVFGRDSVLTIEQAKAEIANAIKEKEDAYIYRKGIGYLFSQGGFYQNLFNPSWFRDLKKFIQFFAPNKVFSISVSKSKCAFCSMGKYKVEAVDITQMSFLFPVFGEFPNAYWQNDKELATQVCSLCKFLILHHHLAFTRLSDGSEIFINAPSFKVMYYLNRFAREVFGASSQEEARSKREILAMSVIEYATKIKTTLGVWTGMNIEVVSRRGSQIEYFSLPYEVIELISDRRIAALLSQIGEFTILNLVLTQDFSRLMEMGYRLLRIGLKPYGERGKSENDFVSQTLRLDKNRQNPTRVAEQIFQLCALVEEKRNRRSSYEYAGAY